MLVSILPKLSVSTISKVKVHLWCLIGIQIWSTSMVICKFGANRWIYKKSNTREYGIWTSEFKRIYRAVYGLASK